MGIMGEVADVLMPRVCAGCGAWDESLCRECRCLVGSWRAVSAPFLTLVSPHESEEDIPLIPVWALGVYEAELRSAIIAWKNRADRQLTRIVKERVKEAATSFLLCSTPSGQKIDVCAGDVVNVVPAPSGWKRKHRGLFVTGYIAQAMVDGLRVLGVEAYYADILSRSGSPGGTVEQRARKGRSVRVSRSAARAYGEYGDKRRGERIKNDEVLGRNDGFNCVSLRLFEAQPQDRVLHALKIRSKRRCIVVDDVLTTGATLSGCVYALQNKGYSVVAGVVMAVACAPGIDFPISAQM